MRKAKIYLFGGLIMAGASLCLRLMGMAYTVFVSGKLGAEGMGLITLVSSVYGLAVTFATSGVHLTCTRLVADALALNSPKEAGRALRGCLLFSLSFGVTSAICLFSLSDVIGNRILNDPRTVFCLRALCPALPAASLNAAMNGYFTAARRVGKSAPVAIVEQSLKIIFTAFALSIFLPRGKGVEAVFVSSSLSEVSSFAILAVVLFLDKKRHLPNTGRTFSELPKRILSISMPVAFTAWVRSALVTAEHVLIPKGLKKFGVPSALGSYGKMHGMALPTVLFPAAILSSFTGLLIPEISRFHAEGKEKEINDSASRMLRIALLFSLFCAGFMTAFGKELGQILYKTDEVGRMITLFSLLIPVMYIDTAADAVLKGLGEQIYCMEINILDAGLSLLLVGLLVPQLGVLGYLLTVFISECFNTFFSILRLRKRTKLHLSALFSVILPTLSATIAAFLTKLMFIRFSSGIISLICAFLFFAAMYIALIFMTKGFTKEDQRYFLRLFKGK